MKINYKPCKGFFDLSVKPKELDKKTYAKILNIQNYLIGENRHLDYYLKPYNKYLLQKLQELSASLQQIILSYWVRESK